jgi:hypothetical protein
MPCHRRSGQACGPFAMPATRMPAEPSCGPLCSSTSKAGRFLGHVRTSLRPLEGRPHDQGAAAVILAPAHRYSLGN